MRSHTRKAQNVIACSLLFLVVLLFPVPAKAATFCVSTPAELATALSDAQGNGEDDVVQIVQGTYRGNFVYDPAEVFDLTIEGGYLLGCSGRTVDPANTVLDGMGTGRVLALGNDRLGVDFVVDGLTLRNGKGGLYISAQAGRVTLTNNVITRNSTEGGGAYIGSANVVDLIRNVVTGNSGQDGGGISIGSVVMVNVADNLIRGNSASRSGGGLYINGSSTVNVDRNVIQNNSAIFYGGGLWVDGSTTLSLTDNAIEENASGRDGGGLFVTNAVTIGLVNNTLTGNSTGGSGGGIYAYTYKIGCF